MNAISLCYKTKITTSDGLYLHLEIKEGDHKEWIIITHGIGEHLGRHSPYLLELFSHRFNLLFYDLRGHGQSGGKRAYIEDFSWFLCDLYLIITYLQESYNMKSYSLMGHSMGGLITSYFMKELLNTSTTSQALFKNKLISTKLDDLPRPSKVFLSAPPVGTGDLLGNFLYHFPKVTTSFLKFPLNVPLKGMVDLSKLSHRGDLAEEYKSDPLNSLTLSSKLLLNLIQAATETYQTPLGIVREKIPLGVAYGSKDKVINTKELSTYFTKKEVATHLLSVTGGLHELHNEVPKFRVPYFNFLSNFFSKN